MKKKISSIAILALIIIIFTLSVWPITPSNVLAVGYSPSFSSTPHSSPSPFSNTTSITTVTPIKHLVILYQENNSFDHYFGTYPNATNPADEPKFIADPHTPSINGLLSAGLLTNNLNSANPFRLDRSQAITCDMNHGYKEEQQASNGGLMDKFVEFTGAKIHGCNPNQVMGYYDGNTVTALWNYAQHFAMSDNFFE